MDLQQNPKIQSAIASHLATGQYASAEEVVLVALEHLANERTDHEETLASLERSFADEKAGRVVPLTQVVEDVREKHGFREPT